MGRHVLPYFENKPGKHIGEVTRAAYEAQSDGAFSSEEEALGSGWRGIMKKGSELKSGIQPLPLVAAQGRNISGRRIRRWRRR